MRRREKELRINKPDKFHFIESNTNNTTFWRGLHELKSTDVKRIWRVQIFNENMGNSVNLSIGISNQYGLPKRTYFMNVQKRMINTNNLGITKVQHGDIISIVYIRWMILKTGSKRIVFFVNDKPCDITIDINYIVWHHDYKLTAKVIGDCRLKILN